MAGLPEVFVFYFMLDGSKFGSGTGLQFGSGSAKEKSYGSVSITPLTITSTSFLCHEKNLRAWSMWQAYLKFLFMLDGSKSGSGTGLQCGSGSAKKKSCGSGSTTHTIT